MISENSIQSPISGLTLYDYHREPRPPITDDSTTTIQIRNLNIELTCPICLGILHNTMTVMECLHRFCSGCISKSLRLGKKECPTCRVKCSSRRHLRADPNFDGIIAQIYPDLDEFEAKEESMIEQINKKIMKTGSLSDSIELGKKRQALAKASRPKRDRDGIKSKSSDTRGPKMRKIGKESKERTPTTKKRKKEGEGNESNKTEATPPRSLTQGPEISFVLLRHPNEKDLAQLANKYLKTSRQLTIRHLCKFLAKKFDMPDFKVFNISLFPNSQPLLAEDLTLDMIDKDLWKNNNVGELKLFYKLHSTVNSITERKN